MDLNKMGSDKIPHCFEIAYRVGMSKIPRGVGQKGEVKERPLMYLRTAGLLVAE